MIRWGLLVAVALSASAAGQTIVARGGKALVTVYVSPEATESEKYAAAELAKWLGEMSRATIPVTVSNGETPANAILVGRGIAAERHFPGINWDSLGMEQSVVRTAGSRTLVAGGRPRGTLYAAYRLLHKMGCRWWTPWAQTIPSKRDLTLPKLELNEQPAFESRDSFWYSAFDGDWSARNYNLGGLLTRLEEKHGGSTVYAGFVHTFYPLVPPSVHAKEHPEWYSLINGQRVFANAQLCATNPELRKFMLQRVREELQKTPKATIISASQNDCFNPCQCEVCQALVREQGSEAGPMIALANYIAEGIEKDHPNVAVDTLAYQYTRKAPRTLIPRKNVIVRLCSIECSFSQPLAQAANAAFANDIRDWSRLTQRLYIWNYNTNFARYPQPLPNYFVMGPNQRFFKANGVKGIFEQGAYQSNGGEMAELKAWVQAQLLYDPSQDDGALIDEFLKGYYGNGWRPIRKYLDLMADSSKEHAATIYDGPDKPFLSFDVIRRAEGLWSEAIRLTARQPDHQWRVRQGRLGVHWVWLNRWNAFRSEAVRRGVKWPVAESRKQFADEWLAVATGPGPAGWTPMTLVSEGGIKPEDWIRHFAVDTPPPMPLPERAKKPAMPADLDLRGKTAIDLQDDLATLWNQPDGADLVADHKASDGIAVRMPGSHLEWAFQIAFRGQKGIAPGRYRVVVVARAEGAASGQGCTMGVYDSGLRATLASRSVDMGELSGGYKSFELGVVQLGTNSYVYVAPPARGDVKWVWVDRVVLVKE
jgi:hypothetical protein